ncbi:hypothetical protein [Actinomyces qiguomingii]|uniref:hypothetical protein n=1 Tax=Actinomyces qiguomingii TaxID=2057800 RepID=UPI000FFF2D76|nr:hypothetical protein [Actinomyces qiguomingii]
MALPAREAVRVVVDVLRREGFSLESWDVDPFLREYGPWTGAALRRGHAIKLILLTPVVYMVAPLALLVPWVRWSLGVVKMVAYEGLPDDHPFQMQQWWRIRRAAQKAARSRR